MFDATLHKQKMFDQTKRSAVKLKDIPCKKVSSCSFEEPPISFSLTAYYAMRAEIFGCLPFIRTTRVVPGKNFLHKHGFIRFGRVGRIARTMYKHTEKSRKLSRFQSQPIYFQKLSK